MEAHAPNGGCSCKLGRVSDRRGVRPVLADIEASWRDEDGSLRELADAFNRRLLGRALEAAGHPPLDGEAANLYRLLSADGVSGGMRTQARNRLDYLGVDVEAVTADFVSYQTVNRHLKGCRGFSEADRADAISIEDGKSRLLALRNRTVAVTEQTIGQLSAAGLLDVGTGEVHVDIGVTCTDCETQLNLAELFSRGSCQCQGT